MGFGGNIEGMRTAACCLVFACCWSTPIRHVGGASFCIIGREQSQLIMVLLLAACCPPAAAPGGGGAEQCGARAAG